MRLNISLFICLIFLLFIQGIQGGHIRSRRIYYNSPGIFDLHDKCYQK